MITVFLYFLNPTAQHKWTKKYNNNKKAGGEEKIQVKKENADEMN